MAVNFTSKAMLKYENMEVIESFKIDVKTDDSFEKLEEFCHLFNLTNLIKIDTGLSHYHKMITTAFE